MSSSFPIMRKPAAQQRGFSLITTLILLIVVTVLGLAASRIVLMSEKTSRFDRDTQIAFQAAEAALQDAEIDIQGTKDAAGNYVISGLRMGQFDSKTASTFISGCGTGTQRGMCKSTTGAKPIWYQVNFTDESANAQTVKFGEFTNREFSVGPKGIRPEMAPRYIIEPIDYVVPGSVVSSNSNSKEILYRITAMGFGPRKETQVVLQVVLRKV